MNKHIKFCKLKVIFQPNNRLRNYFCFKDFVSETSWSSLIYKFWCGRCTASYIGNTYRHFKVRVSEYQGVSLKTGKKVKGTLSTSVRDHMLVCDHRVVHKDFKFPGNQSNRYLLELKEILFIYSLKEITHHVIITYTCRSYYCCKYAIQDNFPFSNFATDIILIISVKAGLYDEIFLSQVVKCFFRQLPFNI